MIKWMRKVLLSGCIPSVICFFLLLKMNYSILSSWPQNQSIDNRVKLALLFIHLIMMFAILAPLISRLLSRVGNERLNKFIDLLPVD